MTTATVHLSLSDAHALAVRILEHNGFNAAHAHAIADTVVAGERDGCASHGLYRVLGCVHTLKQGKASGDAEPVFHRMAPALLRVDAQQAFYSLAYQQAVPQLIEMAREQGIAAMGINNCVHYAALWRDIEAFTAAGLVAIACTPSHAWVTPYSGSQRLLGTNPFAFGWPRPDGRDPYIFDFATSASARGEIELHRRAGKPIPEGWGVDEEGNACTDAAKVLRGAQLTFGGHKGSALSVMIELLAGPLIADMTSRESLAFDGGEGKTLPMGGELVIVIDPKRFLGEYADQELARAETSLFKVMEDDGVRMPGARRYRNRAVSRQQGVDIPQALFDDLNALL
ncbi:Ldh family oxidoreductase [Zymobacter sp. IVIA_12111.31 C1]|uniref:Ldh family oxidoreductase n=1 Tax=Zymobacter sp. IVIA_12111.31 C1 TaxID=3394854 RepID=UPI0039C337B7